MDLEAKPGCCQEAAPLSILHYIPCNKLAVALLISRHGEGPYRMCAQCAEHNRRRGFTDVEK